MTRYLIVAHAWLQRSGCYCSTTIIAFITWSSRRNLTAAVRWSVSLTLCSSLTPSRRLFYIQRLLLSLSKFVIFLEHLKVFLVLLVYRTIDLLFALFQSRHRRTCKINRLPTALICQLGHRLTNQLLQMIGLLRRYNTALQVVGSNLIEPFNDLPSLSTLRGAVLIAILLQTLL